MPAPRTSGTASRISGPAEQIKTVAGINALVDRHFARLRDVDTETRQQWLHLERSLSQPEKATRRIQSRLIPRLAFALAAIAIVGVYIYLLPRQPSTETVATKRGQQTRLMLQDGSEVTLNYASELVVPKLQADRPRVFSLKGEAFFRVRRHDTPFIVSTSYAKVQVVGTEFNLREREGTLEVAVIHGSVNVSAIGDSAGNTLMLSKGQRAICSEGGGPTLISGLPSADYPGWLYGKLFLTKASFADACREMEMQFDITIMIDDPKLMREIISGTLNAKSAESALNALCGLTGKQFRRDGHVYHVF